jgi:hypothetical protein
VLGNKAECNLKSKVAFQIDGIAAASSIIFYGVKNEKIQLKQAVVARKLG